MYKYLTVYAAVVMVLQLKLVSGNEKILVKNPQFTSKCSPDVSGWGREGENFDFGFEHLKTSLLPELELLMGNLKCGTVYRILSNYTALCTGRLSSR